VHTVTNIVTTTFELRDRRAFGIEICVRVVHGYGDRRMPKQLLDGHYIRPRLKRWEANVWRRLKRNPKAPC